MILICLGANPEWRVESTINSENQHDPDTNISFGIHLSAHTASVLSFTLSLEALTQFSKHLETV